MDVIPILRGRRILLGVSGSIAAYKAADLASLLTQAGAHVDAILTAAPWKVKSDQRNCPHSFAQTSGG